MNCNWVSHVADSPYVSLFTGIGGLDLAVRLALPGSRTVCYVENDLAVCRILAARMEEGTLETIPVWSDVRTFPCELYRGRVAGIIGGFPCTDLSLAGKRAGIHDGKASGLWWEYLRIIREVGPAWVFIENVPGLLCSPGSDLEPGDAEDGESADWTVRNIDAVLGPLADLGFDSEWMCLRASDVGASQERKRVFILAYRPSPRLPGSQDARTNSDDAGEHGSGSAESERSCGELANSSDGQFPQPGRRPQTGDGARSAGPQMEHPQGGGRGELRIASGSRGQLDGADQGMDHPSRQPESDIGSGRRGVCEAGAELGDSALPRLEGRRPQTGDGARPAGVEMENTTSDGREKCWGQNTQRANYADAAGGELGDTANNFRGRGIDAAKSGTRQNGIRRRGPSSANTELFPPGPGLGGEGVLADIRDLCARSPRRAWERYQAELRNTLRWAEILERDPQLSPQIEPGFRCLADGISMVVDEDRPDQLRACGNAVVVLQAALAFRILARRFGDDP